MVDEKSKCEKYMKARENSGNNSVAARGWHKIELAPPGSTPWRQKSATIGGNKDISGPAVFNRHGIRKVNGYIGKNGFNPHT